MALVDLNEIFDRNLKLLWKDGNNTSITKILEDDRNVLGVYYDNLTSCYILCRVNNYKGVDCGRFVMINFVWGNIFVDIL
jgi:hypothetical protein